MSQNIDINQLFNIKKGSLQSRFDAELTKVVDKQNDLMAIINLHDQIVQQKDQIIQDLQKQLRECREGKKV